MVSPSNIPASLRDLASRIDSGELNPETVLLCWADAKDGVQTYALGALPDRAEAVGLFKMAADKGSVGAWA